MSSSPPLEQHEDAASSTPRQALSPDTSPSRVTTVPTDALTGTSPLPVRSSTGRPHSVSSRSSPYSRPHSPARHTVGGEVVNIPRTAQYHAVGMPARHPLGVQSESMQSDDTSTESLESGGSTDGHSDIASSGSPTTVAMRRTHETVLATHAPHDATTRALGEDPLDRESRFLSPLGIDGDVYSGDENNDEASEAVGGSSISSAPGIGVSASDVQKADASLAAACSSGGAKDVASCPICLDTIREAFMTACGHSFCYRCISQHLCEHQSCPTCFQALDSDQIYPNFALNRLILRKSAEADGADALQRPASLVQQLRDSVQEGAKLDADEIDALLLVLQKKKQALRTSERRFEVLTMRQFLTTARARKMAAMDVLRKELLLVDEDMEYVCAQLDGCRRLSSTLQAEDTYTDSLLAKTRLVAPSVYGKQRVAEAAGAQVPNAQPGECSEGLPETPGDEPRNKRVDEHYSDLETFYFNSRMRNGALASEEGLGEFMETLTTVARHEKLRPVATLRYGDSTASTAIVASIEFDRDDEIFAVAGVTRKIKIYDYSNMMQQADIWNDLTQITRHRRMQQQQQQGAKQADRRHDWWARGEEEGAATAAEDGHASMPTALQYPLAEFTNRSKISCLSYNPYIKAQLACSDYDGTISLWDVNAGTPTMYLGEHEKRAWSVDFSQVDPTRLCSGSDDGKVKIWTTNRQASVMTIEGKANVCCVRFSPTHSNIMSFGSADHNVHCFDLRSPNQPLCVLRGHRKAVSYTRFLSPDEIVSASTDSSLKLWNLRTQECVRSFTGHTNEKNFVGLTTSGSEWIACGSENNTMYAYHRNLSHPVVVHRFGNCNSVTGAEQPEDDPSLFVSAVCWKKKSNTILSANSQGIIKVLDMA
ncbi:hypothetical protein IW140_000892 [Coemansia sp. RSA 1813]|nr:hypothetical protein EV178_001389 [Coemansia sp. RSA 1646]KAJ1770639.1 hypothetical protein LPJ74_003014 [Coemansia sp. RSA 1843]KAJ2217241.1 hypothetical protein EV179_000708 [Coemansia sp. RSA 487]KAJ2572441.1 hypothetical protein IW140_000892 [Coemansia sp. RSA 1813]